MMAFDLIVLGRQLAKIGESVMRQGSSTTMSTGAGMVLTDVLAHPGSSISEITARTAMPQSQVSVMVADLAEKGMVESGPDPADRRRTIVHVTTVHQHNIGHAASIRADSAIVSSITDLTPEAAITVVAMLEDLAARLRPKTSGPIVEQINRVRDELSRSLEH